MTRFRSNIDRGIRNVEQDPESNEKWLPKEIMEELSYLHEKLEPHLIEIVAWGTYCDDAEVLEEVLTYYRRLNESYPESIYPYAVSEPDGTIRFYEYRYQPHMLQMYATCTQEWNESTEAHREEIRQKARDAELRSLWGWCVNMPRPNHCTMQQYEQLKVLFKFWDGSKSSLAKIRYSVGLPPEEVWYNESEAT